MAVSDLMKKIPRVGAEIFLLLRRPRAFVRDSLLVTGEGVSVKELMACALGMAIMLWSIYSYFLESPILRIHRAVGLQPSQVASDPTSSEEKSVRFVGVAWTFRYVEIGEHSVGHGTSFPIGFSIDFPQLRVRGTNAPQVAVFGAGIGRIIFDNVVPARVGGGAILGLLLLLYALVTTLCLHPPFRAMGIRVPFRESFRLCIAAYSALVLAFATLAIVGSLLLFDVLHLTGLSLIRGWLLLVTIPAWAVGLRAVVTSFSELYGASFRRLSLAMLGAVVLSAIVSPVVFLPLLYLLLRYSVFWSIVA